MARLSVNVNKIATLRNARGADVPNVRRVALDCVRFGAEGITVHPRPDERHIRYADVHDLKSALDVELNVEGNPDDRFIRLIEEVKPSQVTLVPDSPNALTSNAGWQVEAHFDHLSALIRSFHSWGVRTSIFVGTDLDNITAAASTGTDRIELYTEPYAHKYALDKDLAITPFVRAATYASTLGLTVNAGHDLNLQNLGFFVSRLAPLAEVSIGHALIADALYFGLQDTVKRYLLLAHASSSQDTNLNSIKHLC